MASGTEITLTCATAGANIRYTTNGSNPTATSGTLYSASSKPKITAATTLKAIAYASGMTDSDIFTAAFTVSSVVGGIDSKLVGEWGAGGATGVSNYNPITREYTPFGTTMGFAISFSNDGKYISATYQQRLSGYTKETMAIFGSANYQVLGSNTIKLTKRTSEIFYNDKSDGQKSLGDIQFQYMIGTDEYGAYLIENLGSDQPLNPTDAVKYRKYN